MKKRCSLLFSVILLIFSHSAFAASYDQTTPAATVQSFILAMLRGDSKAFSQLTKDVMPWYYFESDLLEFADEEMSESTLSDYYYYESDSNTIVLYNSQNTPSPQNEDFFCIQLVRANGEYYINELRLPRHTRGVYSHIWQERCDSAMQSEGKCLAYVQMAADAKDKSSIQGNTEGFELNGTILTKYSGNASSVVIPDGITGIWDYAFAQNTTLQSIIIPSSVTSIGEFAFYDCSSLESIQFPSAMTSISQSAFYKCTSLKTITLPYGIESISSSLFYGCSSLYDVTIPTSVTRINSGAFSSCRSLEKITIPENVSYIESGAFDAGFGVTLQVVTGSKAERFARDNWFDYEYYTPETKANQPTPSKEPPKQSIFDYDQSSRMATAQSFIFAMLNGDTKALTTLTKDIIPWYYFESDLLEHGTNTMDGSEMTDFCYFESDENTIVLYDKRVTPSPDIMDFYCMDFVKADGKYYISELHLPHHSRGVYGYKWDERCKAVLNSVGSTLNTIGSIQPTPTNTPIPEWQRSWESINKKMQLIDISLDPDPRYLFETFVEEYRKHPYHRAWTAVLSSGEIVGELPSSLIKIVEGNVQDLCDLFSTDAKVANLVIEYLAGSNFSERYQAQEALDTASEIITIEDGLHSHIEFSVVSNLRVYSVKDNRQLKLSDVMCITYDNYDDVYHKLMAIRNPADGTVDLTHPSIIANMYIDAPTKLGNKVQEKLGKRIIEEHGSDSFEMRSEISSGKSVLKGIEIFNYLIEPIFSGYGAYVEWKKYEAVLNQYEIELQAILDCSNSKNTDRIVEKVMDILTDTVAEGIVLSMEKEIFADTAASTGELLLDISCIPLAVVNIEGAILQLVAHTSNTFGKVWGLEDLYEEFQISESTLLASIKTFYSNPSDATYADLRANHQYYSILVNSGANAVSSIYVSDAEAGINKFKNWVGQIFSGSKNDPRLEQLEYGKKIPSEDAKTLESVTKLIFGQ